MDKIQRIEYICEMYRKVYSEAEDVSNMTKINNATIDSICNFEGPAYFRVRNWIEKKVGEIIQKEKKGELDVEGDIQKFHKELKNCYELMQGRMDKYGNSWRIMDIRSIATLIMMKMDRISELGEDNAKTRDELVDSINYCTFALIKFNEKQNELSHKS